MNLRAPLAVASAAALLVACAAQRPVVLLAAGTPGPSPCAGTQDDICLTACDELVSRLAPRIAPRVVACLRRAKSGDTCVPPAAYACVEDALPTTRRDPLAEADCDRLARTCSGKKAAPGWRRNCSSVFPSLTLRGRAAAIACMSAQDCGGMPYFDEDVGSCIYDDHAA